MNIDEVKQIVSLCHFPSYTIEAAQNVRGEMFLQAHFRAADSEDPMAVATFYTRKWFISPEMTKSEIVQTAFKCVLTSEEHETREKFTYHGQAIFGPHFDVDKLHSICGKQSSYEVRQK